MTGYSALLFPVFVSPCTGFTLTCTDVFSPNGGSGKSLKVTVFVSPMSSRSIVCFFTIGVVPFGIVSVTSMPTSWFSPVFLTNTSNARSVDALIVVSVSGDELDVAGLHEHLLEAGAVDAGRRATGRGTVDAEPDRGHRARRVQLDGLDEHRRRAP